MRETGPDAVSLALSGELVKLFGLIEAVKQRGEAASVGAKGAALQALIDGMAAAQLGRWPREPRRESQRGVASEWCCSRCGSRQQWALSYSGSYERTVAFKNGVGRVRIPRIRCRCGGSVPPDFGPLLPKRQRLWYDLRRDVIERYTNGESYRAVRECLQRRGVGVGLSGLPGMVAACRDVSLHAQPAGGRVRAAQADGAFWRLGLGSRAILTVTEVLERAKPKQVGRHLLRYETGQILASQVAPEEDGAHWQVAFHELLRGRHVPESGELFLTSDGNEGLRGAAETVFGFATQQRCTWHIGHRARQYAPEGQAESLERAVHHLFNAPTWAELCERLPAFLKRWNSIAPEAVASVVRKLPQAVSHWIATDHPLRPKTAAIAERHNQEYKRRLKPTRRLFSRANLEAIVRLIDLRHNCARQPGADWLHCIARDLWPQPIQLHHTTTPTTTPANNNGLHNRGNVTAATSGWLRTGIPLTY